MLFKKTKNDRIRIRPAPRPGSKSPMAYYRAPANQTSPPQVASNRRVKKIKRIFKSLTIKLALTALTALFIFSLLVSSDSQITIDSSAYRPLAKYKSAVNQQFRPLKSRTKLTLNETAIKSALQAEFPEIADVSITLPAYSRTPHIKLTISPPSFFLSGADGTSGAQTRFIVADNGKAVAPANSMPKITNLPLIKDQSNFPVRLGTHVLGKGTSNFIIAVIIQSRRASVPIESFNLPSASEELDLKTADQPYVVKFDVSGDPALQTGRFLAARAQFAQDKTQPQQYLDVRVDGRIYYN